MLFLFFSTFFIPMPAVFGSMNAHL